MELSPRFVTGLWIGALLSTGLASAGELAQVARKVPPADMTSGQTIVTIPGDWKSYAPFAERFAAPAPGTAAGSRVIDLAAVRFETAELASGPAGAGRVFTTPALGDFAKELMVEPFATADRELFLVQAGSPVDQSRLREALTLRGIPILAYVPEFAYLVRLGRAERGFLAQEPSVVWAGLFQPGWRIQPKLDWVIESEPRLPVTLELLVDTNFLAAEPLQQALEAAGAKTLLIERSHETWIARAEGLAITARDLALVPGVLWVDRFVPPETLNNVARTSAATLTARGAAAGPIMDVEDVWARGIRGEGQVAAVADTGLSTGNVNTLHWDFGQVGVAANPQRLVTAYALGRAGDWSDNQTQGGGHGTHVTGSVLGNGVRSGAAPSTNTFPAGAYAGNAPKAGLVFQSLMSATGALSGIPANLNTLFQTPYNDGARVHTNSWGSSQRGVYTLNSSQVDQFTWNNKDMVILFAAGNDGADGRRNGVFGLCLAQAEARDGVIDQDSMASPATAKNCITVGASENYRPDFVYEFPAGDCTSANGVEQRTWGWFNSCRYGLNPVFGDLLANNANGLGAFSSRGWTDDLRIKPDVVAPGIAITSTRTDLNQAFQQWGTCTVPAALQPFYVTLGGTSMAAPLTAGAAVLVRQYYADGWHANHSQVTNAAPVGAQGFNPTSALVKATLINGAWDMRPGQYGGGATQELQPAWDAGRDLPNNAEGYGRVDVESALFPGAGFGDHSSRDLEVHDETVGLTTGGVRNYNFNVVSGADEVTVTLVWTDPWAASGAGVKLVNDLDLTVTGPGGVVYGPNGVNRVGGAADRRNNVEQARITAPAVGAWSVTVRGFNVPGNGTAGTNTQPYALVISGVLN